MTLSFLCLIFLSYHLVTIQAAEFEPYCLNGGLVTAVAGKDYIIIASDTRLTDGGYQILTRKHLKSRIWFATPGWGLAGARSVSMSMPLEESTMSNLLLNPDDFNECEENIEFSSSDWQESGHSPILVASAGCAADCETLKRQVRSELSSHIHWNQGRDTISASGVATLLGQTLYSRRGFPFYSFCLLAGLDNNSGVGVVHTYDAIGSHERVAVASAGTGREMIQPILDQLFSTAATIQMGVQEPSIAISVDPSIHQNVQRDGQAVKASDQRLGMNLIPPVKTHVQCDLKEAVALLMRAYRSVAEREIGVGDNVCIVIVKKGKQKSRSTMNILRFPLKKH